jgi:hypothetical protein
MRELDLVPTGGRWGSITRLREQTRRLFYAQFVAIYRAGKNEKRRTRQIADDTDFWWDHRSPGQGSLWKSTVRLSEPFFTEIVDSPIPIDMRALRALKRSPMALDIYCWLTYRMSYLKAPAAIPWEALQRQFGAGYAETALGTRHFRESFLKALKKVGVVYPEARIEANTPGVKLIPSRAHVRGR